LPGRLVLPDIGNHNNRISVLYTNADSFINKRKELQFSLDASFYKRNVFALQSVGLIHCVQEKKVPLIFLL